jgi:hypothetical protein
MLKLPKTFRVRAGLGKYKMLDLGNKHLFLFKKKEFILVLFD